MRVVGAAGRETLLYCRSSVPMLHLGVSEGATLKWRACLPELRSPLKLGWQ